MIEPQSSEIEYRQGRLIAEAGNRRLAASQVHADGTRAILGRSRRSLVGLIAAALRNIGLWTLLCAAFVVGGCFTGQDVGPSARSTLSSSAAAAPTDASSPATLPDGLRPAGAYGGPIRARRQRRLLGASCRPC